MKEGDDVRVIRLDQSGADHLIVHEAQHPPRLGDRGTIIEVRGAGDAVRYLVESDDGDGEAVWLAEFGGDELQLESDFGKR